MKNFLVAYGGKILEFFILVGSAMTITGNPLGLSTKAMAAATFSVVVLKIAESVFVSTPQRAAALVALTAPK